MAQLYLRPNGVGDETLISYQYPDYGYHYDKVDEATPDDDATYVYEMLTTGGRDLYTLQDTGQTGTINWIRVYIRCRQLLAGAPIRTVIKSEGYQYETQYYATTSWADYYTQFNSHPALGSWTWAMINNLQAGVTLFGSGEKGDETRCTQVYVLVDYTPPVTIERSVSESLGSVSDSVAYNLRRTVDISEPSISVSDVAATALIKILAASEPTISVVDAILAAIVKPVSVSEPAISVSDLVSYLLQRSVAVDEPTIVVTDAVTVNLLLVIAVSEPAISVTDLVERGFFRERSVMELITGVAGRYPIIGGTHIIETVGE